MEAAPEVAHFSILKVISESARQHRRPTRSHPAPRDHLNFFQMDVGTVCSMPHKHHTKFFQMEDGMATAGEMVAAVAALFAVNTSTVESIDRVLSDAGLRQKGGRGRSAATMSGSDVANLALAMILDASMKDAVAKVGKVASMPLQSATVQWRPVSELPLPPLSQQVDQYHEHPAVAGELDMFPAGSALVSSSSLGAGLAALITAMAENEFRELDEMTINLQMSSHGPSALLVYETRAGVLRVRYETLGPEAERPVFERRLKLDEALLHRLADIIRIS